MKGAGPMRYYEAFDQFARELKRRVETGR
jgi:hypothetical protein